MGKKGTYYLICGNHIDCFVNFVAVFIWKRKKKKKFPTQQQCSAHSRLSQIQMRSKPLNCLWQTLTSCRQRSATVLQRAPRYDTHIHTWVGSAVDSLTCLNINLWDLSTMKSSNSSRFSASARLSSVHIITSPFILPVPLCSSRFFPPDFSLLFRRDRAPLPEIVGKYRQFDKWWKYLTPSLKMFRRFAFFEHHFWGNVSPTIQF